MKIFMVDLSRCTNCGTCIIACRDRAADTAIPPFIRVEEELKGEPPNLTLNFRMVHCFHCSEPACLAACPCEAIGKDGAGYVQIDGEVCTGCGECMHTCPYEAIVFSPAGTAAKCDGCSDEIEQDRDPVCVRACPMRALDFNTLTALISSYGPGETLEDLPDRDITEPAMVFKARRKKIRLVPYDSEKALTLFMRRDPLPPIFSALSEATDIPEGFVGRDELVLKHASVKDLLSRTRNDEG